MVRVRRRDGRRARRRCRREHRGAGGGWRWYGRGDHPPSGTLIGRAGDEGPASARPLAGPSCVWPPARRELGPRAQPASSARELGPRARPASSARELELVLQKLAEPARIALVLRALDEVEAVADDLDDRPRLTELRRLSRGSGIVERALTADEVDQSHGVEQLERHPLSR